MAFTSKNDINIIQESDSAKIGAGAGDDIYVVGPPELLKPNQEFKISDTFGNNTLRLIDGLFIKEAVVTATTLKLTLSNDAEITVLSANNFSFGVGGDAFGRGATVQDYTTFATDTLGLTGLPAVGAPALSVQDVEIGSSKIVTIEAGSQDTFIGTADEEIFFFDAVAALASTEPDSATQPSIDLFDHTLDELRFNLPNATGATTLAALNAQQDVTVEYDDIDDITNINFGPDANGGEIVTIDLIGVAQEDWASVNVSIV